MKPKKTRPTAMTNRLPLPRNPEPFQLPSEIFEARSTTLARILRLPEAEETEDTEDEVETETEAVQPQDTEDEVETETEAVQPDDAEAVETETEEPEELEAAKDVT